MINILSSYIHNKKYIERILCLSFFFFCSLYCFVKIAFIIPPSLNGDGAEYLLVSEAFYDHGTPDVRPEDARGAQIILYGNGDKIMHPYYAGLAGFFKQPHKLLDQYWGLFASKNSGLYGYHFWFYSLTVVPLMFLLKLLGLNQLLAFQLTNYLFLLWVLVYITWFSKLTDTLKMLAMFLFLSVSMIWCVKLTQTEAFSTSFFLLSILSLYDQRYKTSMLSAVMASMQNPPIAFFIPFILLKNILDKGFHIKDFLVLGIIGSFCLFPSAFYYVHFGVPNLIIYIKAIDGKFLTLSRFHSLFFDFSQGMIVKLPLALPFVFVDSFLKFLKGYKKWGFSLFFILILILMGFPVVQQCNWNSSIVSIRYATWMGMLVVAYLLFAIDWGKKFNRVALFLIIFSQLFIVVAFRGLDCAVWKYVWFNQFAQYVLDKAPSLYNPDPEIFYERVLHHEGINPDDSPVIYKNSSGLIRKVMIHESRMDYNPIPGLDSTTYKKLKRNLRFTNGWAYLNFPFKLAVMVRKNEELMNKIYEFSCDVEILSANNRCFLSRDRKHEFQYADMRSDEKAHSGRYSVKITPEKPYALTTKITPVTVGEHYYIDCYKSADHADVCIVGSGENPDDFYVTNFQAGRIEHKWQKLSLNITIPLSLNHKELVVYIWNRSRKVSYIDDLKIVKTVKSI